MDIVKIIRPDKFIDANTIPVVVPAPRLCGRRKNNFKAMSDSSLYQLGTPNLPTGNARGELLVTYQQFEVHVIKS